MENKNKKDLSVDELVKQLKVVLDIDDTAEAQAPSAESADSVSPREIPKTVAEQESDTVEDTTGEPAPTPDLGGDEEDLTMQDKIRRFDEFFEEEEERKKRKKTQRKKKAKKNYDGEDAITDIGLTEAEISDASGISQQQNDTGTVVNTPDTSLDAFAEEISGMFSDPEEEPLPSVTGASEPGEHFSEDTETDDRAEPEKEAQDNGLRLSVTSIVEDDDDRDDLFPFMHDATRVIPKTDTDGQTKKFGPDTDTAPDGDVDEELIKEIQSFTDQTPRMEEDSSSAYSESERAIMDALGGIDDELDDEDDTVTAPEVSTRRRGAQHRRDNEKITEPYDEYTDFSQRKTFLDEYKKKFTSNKASAIASFIFAALTLIYECVALTGIKYPHFCSPVENPAVFILIDLQLFALCAVFAARHLADGIKGVFSGRIKASSITALCVILTFVYGICSALLGHAPAHPIMSVSALSVVLMLLGENRAVKRNTLNFRIISGAPGKSKYVMESFVPGKGSDEEKEFHDYVSEDASMLKISRAGFVDGFVGSNLKTSGNQRKLAWMFTALAILTAATGFVTALLTKDAVSVIDSTYTTVVLCTPLAVFTALTLPSYSCAKKSYENDSCVISEAAADEYSGASVVIFNDSDIFPPSLDKITSVRLYNNSRMDHIMYVLTSLFKKIGGPLLTICENAAKEYNEFSNNVVITGADEGCVYARIDGQNVAIGSSAVLGDVIPAEYRSDDGMYDSTDKNRVVRIMYMIINDMVCAKFYIEYEMDKDFLGAIKQLSSQSRCVAIKTLDPNIDKKLIRKYIDTDIYHCNIMRSKNNDKTDEVKKSSTGAIVSRNSVKALLRTLMLADRTVYVSGVNMLICFLSMVVGLVFSIFMIATDTMDYLNVIHILAYQLVLSVIIRITTKISI